MEILDVDQTVRALSARDPIDQARDYGHRRGSPVGLVNTLPAVDRVIVGAGNELVLSLGAVEIMGMSASGAEFGLPTVHYFWVGAVPAMLFLGVVMMPFYYGSKVRSVPEFMFRRFGTGAHLVNAISFAVAQLLIAGINLFLLAILALCIGACCAIFTVVRSVLLRPLPYPEPERLTFMYDSFPGAGVERATREVRRWLPGYTSGPSRRTP